jgi:hypothetical protein
MKLFTAILLGTLIALSFGKDSALTPNVHSTPTPAILIDTAYMSYQMSSIKNELDAINETLSRTFEANNDRTIIARAADRLGFEDWFMNFLTIVLIVLVGFQLKASHATIKHIKNDAENRERFEKLRLRGRVNINVLQSMVYIETNVQGTKTIRVDPLITNDGETVVDSILFLPRMPYGKIRDDLTPIEGVIEQDISWCRQGKVDPIVSGIDNMPRSLGKGSNAGNVLGIHTPLDVKEFVRNENEIPTIQYYAGLIKYRDAFGSVWVRRFIWQIFMNAELSRVAAVYERLNFEEEDTAWPKAVQPPPS